MEEMAAICYRVAIMDQGELLPVRSEAELRERVASAGKSSALHFRYRSRRRGRTETSPPRANGRHWIREYTDHYAAFGTAGSPATALSFAANMNIHSVAQGS